MKHLTESEIIRIFREEWNAKITALTEEVKRTTGGLDTSIVTPDLKVIHKDSGIRYTVDSVGPNDVILRTPEGEKFLVGASDLESDYALD